MGSANSFESFSVSCHKHIFAFLLSTKMMSQMKKSTAFSNHIHLEISVYLNMFCQKCTKRCDHVFVYGIPLMCHELFFLLEMCSLQKQPIV